MSFPSTPARCHCGGILRVFTADTTYHKNMKFRKCQYHEQGSNHHFEWANGHVCTPTCQPRMRNRSVSSTSRSSTTYTHPPHTPLPNDDEPVANYEGYVAELLQIISQNQQEVASLQANLRHRDEVIANFSLSNATLRTDASHLRATKRAMERSLIIVLALVAAYMACVYLLKGI